MARQPAHAQSPEIAPVWVGGKHIETATIPVVNPARFAESVGVVALALATHVERAVEAAHLASTAWSAMPAAARVSLLHAVAADLPPDAECMARLLTREQGKVLWESRHDVAGAARSMRYFASIAEDSMRDRVIREDARGAVWQGRRPVGVVGVIVPWNTPIALAFHGIAPALAAGNTVVVKPSEFAPLALGKTLQVLASRLPHGVVNVVPGAHQTGAALVRNELVRKLFFTGSTATGQQVMRDAAGNLKNLTLELGGNDAAIVLESAVVDDRLIGELVRGVFSLSGQICFGIKRIYVHRRHYPEVTSKFLAAADELVVGDGLDPDVSMGPVNNKQQFDKLNKLLAATARDGATVRRVGKKHDPVGWSQGYFLLPSVVTDVSPKAEVVASEQFGPVIPILPFQDDDDAITMANDTEYGLAASIWSADHEHALRIARRLESGSVFLNAHRYGASDITMPFGGFKRSGTGRNHGTEALESCTELQIVADYIGNGLPL